MPSYANRILTGKYLGASTFAGTLASVNDDPAVGLTNYPGETLFATDGSFSQSFRYVQLDAAQATLVAGAGMYYIDNRRRVVNSDPTKAASYVASTDSAIESAAGCLLNGTATANFGVWLQTGGWITGITTPSAPAKGARLVLSNAAGTAPTNNVWVNVAGGTAPATATAEQLYIMILTSTGALAASGWVMGVCALT
jgi:hypothetical protein